MDKYKLRDIIAEELAEIADLQINLESESARLILAKILANAIEDSDIWLKD